jgi:TIR domain
MSARVFISYRSSDGVDKATALARDLDALFGQDQIFLDKDDLPAGSRWRDVIANTLHASPILLVLVTPHYLTARDPAGQRCIDRDDDPVRDELEAALAAKAHVIPLLCDGVTQTPPAGDLPKPFDQLSELTWRRLRAYDWREDLARLADDLRAIGIVPRTNPGELTSGPLPLAASGAAVPAATPGRRVALAAVAAIVLGGAGFAAWRWYESEAASLAGRWRASVGKRGATSARDGDIIIVTIEQSGVSLRLASSAVDIERDADWQNYRDFWLQKKGQPLNRVFYRGEGVIQSEGDERAPDSPPGPLRILLSVHVDVAEGGEPIDTGALRGTIDPDGKRIRARLWLNSERGERVVDLRREP